VKKTFSAILILALFLNGSGYYIFYKIRKQELKSTMKEYLLASPDPGNLTEFHFDMNDKKSLNKMEWENDHEFWYEDELYDLIEKKTEGDRIIIRCINDKKEGDLMKLMQKISNDNQGNNSTKGRSVLFLKLIQTSFIKSETPEILSFSTHHYSIPYSVSDTFNAYLEVMTPPPRES